MFGANLAIPAQICDELSCGQDARIDIENYESPNVFTSRILFRVFK